MSWKDIPGMDDASDENGSNKKLDNNESNYNDEGTPKEYHNNDGNDGNIDFSFDDKPTSDHISPKNSDIRDRNKKIILISGIALILFSFLVYIASFSRKPPERAEINKEIKMEMPQEDETVEENTAIYSLKREVEELKNQRKSLLNANGTRKEFNTQNNVNTSSIPSSSRNDNSTNVSDVNVKVNSTQLPPLPPPGDVSQTFSGSSPQGFSGSFNLGGNDSKQKQDKYKIILVDSPFQSGSFSRSGKLMNTVYTTNTIVGKDSNSNMKNSSEDLLEETSKSVSLEDKKDSNKDSNVVMNRDEKKSMKFTIPAGSFFKVVLLNGVDAPTGMGGKASPYPVIARVLTDSVLPNRFFADMKGCFVVGAATGELSSERVIMRFTKISCVTRTGKVIEKSITAFIAGEDGKYGLIGRVVSKAGAQLGRVLLAKFVESAGNILTLQSQTIATSGLGTVTTINPEDATKAALYSGFAGAAKSLAEYYLRLADQIFPVIEVNAGRQGDVVLLQNLTIDMSTDLKDNGGFIQRSGVLSDTFSPEDKVFKIKEEIR